MEPVHGIVRPRDVRPERPFALLADAKPDDKAEVEEGIAVSFFPEIEKARLAARNYFARIYTRPAESVDDHEQQLHSFLSLDNSNEQRKAAAEWCKPNPKNSFHRLGELKMPVLILNGNDDVLIPMSHSWELLKGIENAHFIVHPKAGHGFLWQYAKRAARDVSTFLDEDLSKANAKL